MKRFISWFVIIALISFVPQASSTIERKVKVSSNDSTAGYLNSKFVEGNGASLTEKSDGGNETLEFALNGGSINWTDLGNVNMSSLSDADLALYVNSNSNWENKALSGDGTIDNSGSLTLDITESDLESRVSDVSDVFTNKDTDSVQEDSINWPSIGNLSDNDVLTAVSSSNDGNWESIDNVIGNHLTEGSLPDGNVTEADLKVVDSPGDEEIFTYESTTGDFEWHTQSELGVESETHGSEHDGTDSDYVKDAGDTMEGTLTITAGGTNLHVSDTTDAPGSVPIIFEGQRANPADGDNLVVEKKLSDSGGNQEEFVQLKVRADDVTDGTEDGSWIVSTMQNGTLTETLRVQSDSLSMDDGTTDISETEFNRLDGLSNTIVTDNTEVTDVDGTGLSISSGTLSSVLGASIDSSEIVDGSISNVDIGDDEIQEAKVNWDGLGSFADNKILTAVSSTSNANWESIDTVITSLSEGSLPDDVILESDLKAVDSATDEECLTYESTTGDFEWEACGSPSADSVGTSEIDDGSDSPSTSELMAVDSGDNTKFEYLTIGNGINNDGNNLVLDHLASGSDGDSSTTSSDSGLEFVSNKLTMLRGCSDGEHFKWDETNDEWDCSTVTATPGGSNEQFQYNNSGSLGGTSGLNWDSTSNLLQGLSGVEFDLTGVNWSVPMPTSTGPSDSGEGHLQWDTDDDELVVGDGSSTVTWETETHATEHEPGGSDVIKNMEPITLNPKGAEFPGSDPAERDMSQTHNMLLYDASTTETAFWGNNEVIDWDGGTLKSDIKYTMASATSNSVNWDISLFNLTGGDSADIDTDSYDTANNCSETVPGTAGHMSTLSCTLSNTDSIADGDIVSVKVQRDSGDSATGDAELRRIKIYEV